MSWAPGTKLGPYEIILNVPTTSRTSIGFHVIINWTALVDQGGK